MQIVSPLLSADSSPSRQQKRSLEQQVRLTWGLLAQPFPLWANVYSVVFAPQGEIFVVGRIKASCSLQVTLQFSLQLFHPGQV